MPKILVVDDESAVMKLVRCMLKQYNVIEAPTGEEALLFFIDHNYQVDLLVADVTLPTMSGIQVALFLRSKLSNLPVILTSGYPVSAWSKSDSGDLETLGSNLVRILQKPFPAQVLRHAVCELTGEQQPKTATAAWQQMG